jgi:benzoyl-CoA reductase/2-hydroxyglutaryl-CoA dehydratase subunit BcrC/BadD/HgdB
MSARKDRTILNNWILTCELANFILDQEGLTSLDDWGGREVVREILPEDYRANFDMVQPALIDTLLKDKNRGSATTFSSSFADYVSWVVDQIDAGKLLCYHYFPMSVEIMLALDLVPISYELLCGMPSAFYIDGAEDGIDRIEAEGIPDHLCSTQKGTAGYLLMGMVPKPDILVKSATPCDASNSLYEWTAHKFGIPLVVLETPYYRNERAYRYMLGETKRMVEQLEQLSGNALDEDRLRECCRYGNEALGHLLEVQELRKRKPCPDPGWHRTADTAFGMQFGSPMCTSYFAGIHADVKARADRGEGVIPEGKGERRVAYGYTWEAYDLTLFDWLEEEHGVTYMADTLTYFPPDVGLVDTSNTETMLEGIAWRTMQMPMGRQTMGFSDVWIQDIVDVITSFSADALILGGHMACKHFWALNKLLSDRVRDEVGVPTLRFEMDMLDKRFTPPAELRRIMTEFFTTL